MNAPTPQDQLASAKGVHAEEQLDLPGIVSVDPAEAEAESAADASAYDADFLSLDELIEQIRTKKPELPESDFENVRKLFESINDRSNGKMGIPRTVEGATLDNADLALELYNTTKVGTGAYGLLRKQGAVFGSASGTGEFKMREGAVFYHGKGGFLSSILGNKSFTQEDARQIALLAMHNKDMLPPNAIKITGTKEQRAMIKAEIDKLNESLPEGTQLKLTAKQARELAAAPVAATPAQNEPAETPVNEQHELFEAVLRTDPDAGKHPVVGNADIDGVEMPVHETAFSHGEGVVKAHYIDKGDDFKVLAFETDDNFGSYLKTEEAPKSEANASFSGAAAPLTQSHPNFIGPREFVGPRQPAAAPTPPAV